MRTFTFDIPDSASPRPRSGWGDLAAPPASKDRICTHSNGKGREGGWGRYGMDWYGLGSIA